MDNTTIKIEFRDDDEFRASIKNGNPDPIGGVRISANDRYLVGNADEYLPTWVSDFVFRIVDSSIAVLDGERQTVINHNGPSYLVLNPVDETTVELSHRLIWEAVENPDEYPELVNTATTTTDEFISAVERAGSQLVECLTEYNPQLEETDTISEMEDALEQLMEHKHENENNNTN
ncbi:hypothetical protein ACFOZ7_21650 [Natribaculum luteum]|uniref:Uncharacterized protein n=1 Tax=Natribaculum luteum TaxID=1586232 RepID=A0ABD5P5C5_9EURY|nr:hypothetical protein [Natribaculum luteum]